VCLNYYLLNPLHPLTLLFVIVTLQSFNLRANRQSPLSCGANDLIHNALQNSPPMPVQALPNAKTSQKNIGSK